LRPFLDMPFTNVILEGLNVLEVTDNNSDAIYLFCCMIDIPHLCVNPFFMKEIKIK